MKALKSLFKSDEIRNTGWIISGKLAQMALALVVSLWSARYLGPSNYGLLNYASAYVAFFTSLCTLGITSSVLISELTKHPESEGTTLGTSITLRLISSLLSMAMIVSIVFVVDDGDPLIVWIAALSSIGMFFQAFDIIEYWFLKRYLSKITAIASFVGYCIASAYKIVLLIGGRDVVYFAVATSVDYIAIAIFLFIAYKKNAGPKLSFSWKRGKEILAVSYHFILSGAMVAIYGQTDKIMLKLMMSETEVGYYSTASSLSTMWCFVLSAVISSMSPTITRLKKEENEDEYLRKNRQLYGVVFYTSVCMSLLIAVFASVIVNTLYGEAYEGSIAPLRIIVWYVAFSYLGVARDIWLVCENKQKYSKYMYIIAAIANVCMNLLLIPRLGATGAALATLITQFLTSLVIPLLWKDTRENAKLIAEAIFCKDLRERFKEQHNDEQLIHK